MARRTIYVDDATELVIRAAWPDETNMSALFQRAVNALLEKLPPARRAEAFRRAAELLAERMAQK